MCIFLAKWAILGRNKDLSKLIQNLSYFNTRWDCYLKEAGKMGKDFNKAVIGNASN